MTLFDTVRAIESFAAAQPAVAMIVRNDIFRLNTYADAHYGVFAWTQNSHRARIDEDLHYFSFSLFYVDRLTADKGNELEIQSVGIQALENILRSLADIGVEPDGDYTFNTFNQRFLDECAGVWCSVTLAVPLDLVCPDFFDGGETEGGDFNDDFNDDFLTGDGGAPAPYAPQHSSYIYLNGWEVKDGILIIK